MTRLPSAFSRPDVGPALFRPIAPRAPSSGPRAARVALAFVLAAFTLAAAACVVALASTF